MHDGLLSLGFVLQRVTAGDMWRYANGDITACVHPNGDAVVTRLDKSGLIRIWSADFSGTSPRAVVLAAVREAIAQVQP